jgi:small subunit ribosomal protein S2
VAVVTMKQLLEAGVHFGHQTRRWNPKMKRFIFGERNGIYIIDLNQTLERTGVSYQFVRDLVADGGTILFVGTKKQTQDAIARYAQQCGMPYINERWLGGMLTNFSTISGRVKKMTEYQRMRTAGDFEAMPKKEALILGRELEKLERNLGGIRNMTRLPDAVFIIDTKKEHIAVTEANKLGLPIVAVVDTNCDPDLIQYVIPGNDDAIRAGNLMCRVISDAVEEGRFMASRKAAANTAAAGGPAADKADPEAEARRAQQQAEARRAAALQAQEREARLAATKARQDVDDQMAPAEESTASGDQGTPSGEASLEAEAVAERDTAAPNETAAASHGAAADEPAPAAEPEPEPAAPEPAEPAAEAPPAPAAAEAPEVPSAEAAAPEPAADETPTTPEEQ